MDFYGINVKANVTGESTPDLGTSGTPFGVFYGEATSAEWGDLAEKYRCPEGCEFGTVMSVSKKQEIDLEPCNEDLCTSFIGVISTKPGFKMNSRLEEGQYVGLTGLLPVKIVGSIEKSDFIVPTTDGCARKGEKDEIAYKIGVANASKSDEGIDLVDCIIK